MWFLVRENQIAEFAWFAWRRREPGVAGDNFFEAGDRLFLAVFQQAKIIFGQTANMLSLFTANDDGNLHEDVSVRNSILPSLEASSVPVPPGMPPFAA